MADKKTRIHPETPQSIVSKTFHCHRSQRRRQAPPTGAALGSIAGPVGTVVGGVIGAIAGKTQPTAAPADQQAASEDALKVGRENPPAKKATGLRKIGQESR